MAKKTDPKLIARPLPADVAELAYLDIADICAAVRMSPSWVHEEVRAGRAPAPAIRKPRCTRWSSAQVRAWLIELAERAASDAKAADQVAAKAKAASTKAREPAAVAKAQATRKARIAARAQVAQAGA